MKAYTSSNSSRAMSVARVADGSSTTSPACSFGVLGSSGRLGSPVTEPVRNLGSILLQALPGQVTGALGFPSVLTRDASLDGRRGARPGSQDRAGTGRVRWHPAR